VFDVYTTLEPCSLRLSGKQSCTVRLLQLGVSRVFIGALEPDLFVRCEGRQLLGQAGVEVQMLDEQFGEASLKAATRPAAAAASSSSSSAAPAASAASASGVASKPASGAGVQSAASAALADRALFRASVAATAVLAQTAAVR
jgi:hypothetical protein